MADFQKSLRQSHTIMLCVGLVLITLAGYWGIQHHDFISLDDSYAVVKNPHLTNGITTESVLWAFTTNYCYPYWMPLSWISFLLDYQLFGLNAGAFHLVNLFFHLLNVILIFLVLRRLSGLQWQSVFAACLFAVHPINVESVVWVSAQKDTLSAFFWLLTMLFYVSFVSKRSLTKYILVVLAFLCALLAKPMAVTLPFALLLLDFWPMSRFFKGSTPPESNLKTSPAWRMQLKTFLRLVKVKIPLFVISFSFVALNIFSVAKSKNMVQFSTIPLKERVANAIISYVQYLENLIHPVNLGVFYPHLYPPAIPFYKTAVAGSVLLGISIASISLIRRAPYVIFGWLWFLGTLVPVIGLTQAGAQGMADRFVYVPALGLFIIVAWGAADFSAKLRMPLRIPIFGVSVILIGVLFTLTRQQMGYWKDSISLFEHTLAVTKDNYVIQNNLGVVLMNSNKEKEAIVHFRKALSISPFGEFPWYNIGLCYEHEEMLDSAKSCFQKAIDLKADHYQSYHELGQIFANEKEDSLAVQCYMVALYYKPDYLPSLKSLGIFLYLHGRFDESVVYIKKALSLEPNSFELQNLLGLAIQKRN